jgi:hypothetical protein
VLVDDLVKNASFVTYDCSSQADIEIFEGDGEQVGAVEGAKKINARRIHFGRIDAGRQWPMVANAL